MSGTAHMEKVGIHYLKDALLKCPLLDPYLSENDRTPLWDGSVFVYDEPNQKNKHLLGTVPVQVKTRTRKYALKEKIKFNIEMSDLDSYYRDGGILYIVIYEKPDTKEHRIYYSILLPFDLAKIMKGKKLEGSIPIDFDSFPDSIFDITNIFMGFLEERPRQHHIVESGYQSIEELIKNGVQIKAFSFSLPNYGYEKTDPHILLSRSNVYLNAELAGGYKVPIEKLEHPHVSRTIDHSVTIGEKIYYSTYEEQYVEGVKSILIGESITLIVSGISSGKLSFVVKGSLTQRIQDLEFILAATSNVTFSLDGQSYTIKDVENKQCEINRALEHYRTVKHMLDALDVHEELNVDCITEIDSRTINELIDAVIYGQHMYMPGIQDSRSIITFRFANLYIIIWAEKDQEGKYSIEPFTQCGLIKVKYEKTKRVETVSPYVFLGEEQYKLASNLNYEHIYSSITSIPISEAYSAAVNKSVLNLISAYDAQTKKDTELLVLAERLCDWLSDNNTKSKDIYLLNKLQAIKRQSNLTIEENVEVFRIKSSDEPTLVFGANILLGDEEQAITAFSKIDNSMRQTELIGMPIVTFLTEESRNRLRIAQPEEANSDG